MKKYRFEYFASCPNGLEELLHTEILTLGAKTAKVHRGGVYFESFHEIALKVVLYSRVASRVFKYIQSFEMINEKDYYLEATEVKWETLMDLGHTFRLTTIFGDLPGEREEFRNSQFANLKLKDAIVDYFRHHEGERPSIDRDYPQVTFLARIDRGVEKPYMCTLMYDLCGEPLHMRGYSVNRTEAPIKENLAAGIIQLMRWNPETEGFIDAFCGSGTFVIEAALIAAKIPPSYLRMKKYLEKPGYHLWTFQNLPWLTEDKELQGHFEILIKQITKETEDGMAKLRDMRGRIIGSDIAEYAIHSAKDNLRKAGLDAMIDVHRGDALESTPPTEKSLFLSNPPYGERLEFGEEERLKALYKGIGDHWKKAYKGHRAGIFTGNLAMLKSVGLKTSKKHILFNGDIECRLAEYDLY